MNERIFDAFIANAITTALQETHEVDIEPVQRRAEKLKEDCRQFFSDNDDLFASETPQKVYGHLEYRVAVYDVAEAYVRGRLRKLCLPFRPSKPLGETSAIGCAQSYAYAYGLRQPPICCLAVASYSSGRF